MKKLITVLALTLASVSFADESAARPNIYTAKVLNMRLDPEFVNPARINGGSMSINFDDKTISLVLNRKWSCPPHAMCALVMPTPIVVELPITSITTDQCNVTHYVARKDLRPVDGDMKALTISDVSKSTCPTKQGNTASLETSFVSRMNGKTSNTQSAFQISGFARLVD